jgi:molybdopterin synthase catalytic subunit
MKVRVLLFAGLREALGRRDVALELSNGATIEQLRDQLSGAYPALAPLMDEAVCAVEDEYVTPEYRLRDGASVALIPPVSGGSEDDGPFEVTAAPLDPMRLTAAVRRDEAGAVVLFHGVARNDSEGRRVIALEYDAHATMAEKKLREVADEARHRFPITGIGIMHRTGRLEIGEASLLVAVSSPHRSEAFEACHYAVDRIKQIVPVWKKEIWEDGGGEWVPGYVVDAETHEVTTSPS